MNSHDRSLDEARETLARECAGRSMTIIRGPEDDPGVVYVRGDLSAWGDESAARDAWGLGELELGWARLGLERADPLSEDFQAEARHWREIPGALDWMAGGPHPRDLLGELACGWRRGHASPELSARRVRIAGREALAPREAALALEADPAARELALADPERAIRSWERALSGSWREARFERPVLFWESRLPAIPAGADLTARRRRDGSWIFEHPAAEGWLCLALELGRASTESFFHSGLPPIELEA